MEISRSNRKGTLELAKDFLKKQISRKQFVIDTKIIPNRRVRVLLQNQDFLCSPTKGVHIIKSHEALNKNVVEENYFNILEKLSQGSVVSWIFALHYHLWKIEKIERVVVYNKTKNSSVRFKWNRNYVIQFQKSEIYRETELCTLGSANISIESSISYLISNFQKEKNSKDFKFFMLHINFMLIDIKRFIDNGSSITSLSAMALWYKENKNLRNFNLIKTAIAQCGKEFRYPANQSRSDWNIWEMLSNTINYSEESQGVWEPKIARFNSFMMLLNKQCNEYLFKQDFSNYQTLNLQEFMENIDTNTVHDTYHSLTLEGYNIDREEVIILNDKSSSIKTIGKIGAKQDIKWYLDSYKMVVEKIKSDYGNKVIINNHLIYDIHHTLFLLNTVEYKFDTFHSYRKENIEITGAKHLPPNHNMVDSYMECFISYMNDIDISTPQGVIKKAIMSHFFFVYIHPFRDGNGRIGRFLMNYTLGINKYNWLTILSEDKNEYIAWLREASDNNNIIPFTQFVLSQIKKNT